MTAEKLAGRRVCAALIASAVLVGFSAIIPSATAQDNSSSFSYVRLYCTPDNESHFMDVRAELTKENFAPPAAPIAIGGNGMSRAPGEEMAKLKALHASYISSTVMPRKYAGFTRTCRSQLK